MDQVAWTGSTLTRLGRARHRSVRPTAGSASVPRHGTRQTFAYVREASNRVASGLERYRRPVACIGC